MAPIKYKSYNLNVDMLLDHNRMTQKAQISMIYISLRFVGLIERVCRQLTIIVDFVICPACQTRQNVAYATAASKDRMYANLLDIHMHNFINILLQILCRFLTNGTNLPLPKCFIQDNCTRFSIGVFRHVFCS